MMSSSLAASFEDWGVAAGGGKAGANLPPFLFQKTVVKVSSGPKSRLYRHGRSAR